MHLCTQLLSHVYCVSNVAPVAHIVRAGLGQAINVHPCLALFSGLLLWLYTATVHTPGCVMGGTKAQRANIAKARATLKKKATEAKARKKREEECQEQEQRRYWRRKLIKNRKALWRNRAQPLTEEEVRHYFSTKSTQHLHR